MRKINGGLAEKNGDHLTMKNFIIAIIVLVIGVTNSWAEEEPDWDKLIQAIITCESGGDPHAMSKAGCVGLMQINPNGALKEWNIAQGKLLADEVRKDYSQEDLFDPAINVEVGKWYLRRLKYYYLRENYTLERMLAAYNGGITRLRKNGYDVSKMPKETRQYVQKVMRIYQKGG